MNATKKNRLTLTEANRVINEQAAKFGLDSDSLTIQKVVGYNKNRYGICDRQGIVTETYRTLRQAVEANLVV